MMSRAFVDVLDEGRVVRLAHMGVGLQLVHIVVPAEVDFAVEGVLRRLCALITGVLLQDVVVEIVDGLDRARRLLAELRLEVVDALLDVRDLLAQLGDLRIGLVLVGCRLLNGRGRLVERGLQRIVPLVPRLLDGGNLIKRGLGIPELPFGRVHHAVRCIRGGLRLVEARVLRGHLGVELSDARRSAVDGLLAGVVVSPRGIVGALGGIDLGLRLVPRDLLGGRDGLVIARTCRIKLLFGVGERRAVDDRGVVRGGARLVVGRLRGVVYGLGGIEPLPGVAEDARLHLLDGRGIRAPRGVELPFGLGQGLLLLRKRVLGGGTLPARLVELRLQPIEGGFRLVRRLLLGRLVRHGIIVGLLRRVVGGLLVGGRVLAEVIERPLRLVELLLRVVERPLLVLGILLGGVELPRQVVELPFRLLLLTLRLLGGIARRGERVDERLGLIGERLGRPLLGGRERRGRVGRSLLGRAHVRPGCVGRLQGGVGCRLHLREKACRLLGGHRRLPARGGDEALRRLGERRRRPGGAGRLALPRAACRPRAGERGRRRQGARCRHPRDERHR